jgi:hypothetical protein
MKREIPNRIATAPITMISALLELKLLPPAALPVDVLTTVGVLELVTTGGVGKPDRPLAPVAAAVGVAAAPPVGAAELVALLDVDFLAPAAEAAIGANTPPGTVSAVNSTSASHRRVPLTPTRPPVALRRRYRSDASGCSIAGVFGGLR